MYPAQELTRLAAYKVVLRRKITIRRAQCALAASGVAQPLAWVDRMMVSWRRLSPFMQFAAVPLGFLLKRKVFPRVKILGTLMRWGPLIFNTLRSLRSSANNQRG